MTIRQAISIQLVRIAYKLKLGPKPEEVRRCEDCFWNLGNRRGFASWCKHEGLPLETSRTKGKCGPRGKYAEAQ